MTMEEAIVEFEAPLTVHEQVGCATKANYDGPRDMSRAPSGEKYIMLTSGGIKAEGTSVPSWFANEEDAIDFWLMEAKHYAREHGTQLYWREKPELVSAEFVNLNQAAAIQTQWLRNALTVELHFVACRLLISSKDPSGKEINVT